MARPCIVVFRASEVCYLGVIRSLAGLDVDVVSVSWRWPGAPAFYSDQSVFRGRTVEIANPGSAPQQARHELQSLFAALAADYGTPPLLMPTSDSILTFLLDSPELWPLARLANAWDFPTTHRLLDKFALSQALDGSAIVQPDTRRCDAAALAAMPLPFIVKPSVKDPVNSFYAEFGGAKAIFIRNESERQAVIAGGVHTRYPLIAQQYIDPAERIDDMPVYVATDRDGRVLQCTSVDKVFVHPAGFGTAFIVREQRQAMVSRDEVDGFVSATGLRGIVMLEFIRGRDGRFYFIEANPRPWLLVDYQRLRGRNYFHFLDPASAPDCAPQLDEASYYVELTGLCRSFEKLQPHDPLAPLLALLASLDGPCRLATFDPQDSAPMDAEMAVLGQRYGAPYLRELRDVLGC